MIAVLVLPSMRRLRLYKALTPMSNNLLASVIDLLFSMALTIWLSVYKLAGITISYASKECLCTPTALMVETF
jgi:hypothetical protein